MVTHQAAMEAAFIIITSIVISILAAFALGWMLDIMDYKVIALNLTEQAAPSSGWLNPITGDHKQLLINCFYAIIYGVPVLGIAAAFKRAVLEDERRDYEYDEEYY